MAPLLLKLLAATLTKVVGGTLLNKDWLKLCGLPFADRLGGALDIVQDELKDALPDALKRLFPDDVDLTKWIQDDSLALLAARTAAAIVAAYAQEQSTDFLRDAFGDLAKAVERADKAWKPAAPGLLAPKDLRASALAQFGGEPAAPPLSPLTAEEWRDLLRPLVPRQPAAAWNPDPAPRLTDAQILPVAERLRDRFLAEIPTVLAKDENAVAYRRVLLATLGEGFGGLFARFAETHDDLRTIKAGLARLTTPHLARSREPGSRYAYQMEFARFEGRADELARSTAFLARPQPFLWWRLVGGAGAGKSRFAQEMVERARFQGWEAGWIDWDAEGEQTDLAPWQAWSPDRPTLVVFDDALDHAERFARILAVLGDRARDDWADTKTRVRFLALARESGPVRWNGLTARVARTKVGENLYVEPADDAAPPDPFARAAPDAPFGPGTLLDLPSLDAASLRRIVEDVWDALAPADRTLEPGSVDALLARLSSTPGLLRPLFVQIAAEALAQGDEAVQGDLDRAALVEYVVRREEERWTHDGVPLPYANLALLACLWGEANAHTEILDFPAPPGAKDGLFPRPVDRVFAQSALSLGAGFDPKDYLVRRFEPAVLGEIYVLRRLQGDSFEGDLDARDQAQAVWEGARPLKVADASVPPDAPERARRERTMAFVYRAFAAFPDLARAAGLAEGLDDPQRLILNALELDRLTKGDPAAGQVAFEEGRARVEGVEDPDALAAWSLALFNAHLRAVRVGNAAASARWLQGLWMLVQAQPSLASLHGSWAQALFDEYLMRSRAHDDAPLDGLRDALRSLVADHPNEPAPRDALARTLEVEHLRAWEESGPAAANDVRQELTNLHLAHPEDANVRQPLAGTFLAASFFVATREASLQGFAIANYFGPGGNATAAFGTAAHYVGEITTKWSFTEDEIAAAISSLGSSTSGTSH